MPTKNAPPKRAMTAAHKQALAQGRAEGNAIRAYLTALETHKPKPGRRRTPESIDAQIAKIDTKLDAVDPLKRVELLQRRLDLESERAALAVGNDLAELEAGFITHARTYSQRKGIAYATWRAAGVEASVLKAAGITRGA